MIYHFLKKKELFVNVLARVAWTPSRRDASATNTGKGNVTYFTQLSVGEHVLFQDVEVGHVMYHQGGAQKWVHCR